jgi:hypothetical protein
MNILEQKVIMDKKDYRMTRIKKNCYSFEYVIENNNILLEKIINFDFIKLIYELNKTDIFEDFHIDIHADNRATVYALFNHFFSDFGYGQKYVYLDIVTETHDKTLIFKTKPNNNHLPKSIKTKLDVEIMPVSDIITVCHFINPHKVSIETLTNFHSHFDYPDFMEKMATTIISKIFLRTKQFIEKINIIE